MYNNNKYLSMLKWVVEFEEWEKKTFIYIISQIVYYAPEKDNQSSCHLCLRPSIYIQKIIPKIPLQLLLLVFSSTL